MQAAVSVVWNLEVVRYLGAAFTIETLVGTHRSVHYWVYRSPLLGVSVNRESMDCICD